MKKYVGFILSAMFLVILTGFSLSSIPAEEQEKTVVNSELAAVEYDRNLLAQDADVIIRGTVVSQEVEKAYNGFPATDIFIQVNEVYKGNPDKQVEVRVEGGETEDMIYIPEEDVPHFTVGEEVVVFLTSNKGKRPDKNDFGYYVVGQVQGKFTLSDSNTLQANKYGFIYNNLQKEIDTIAQENQKNPLEKPYHEV